MRLLLAALTILSVAIAMVWFSGMAGAQQVVQWLASASDVPYNTLVVLLGTGTLGLASGVVGSFAVLRRRSLVGDAVAHSALPGLAIAFMVVGERRFGAMLAHCKHDASIVLSSSLMIHPFSVRMRM